MWPLKAAERSAIRSRHSRSVDWGLSRWAATLRAVLLPYGSQGAVGLLQPVRAVQPPSARCWRVVAQGCVVVEAVGGVDAEPGHAAGEPKPQDLLERLVDGRFPPVQVRHARQEAV